MHHLHCPNFSPATQLSSAHSTHAGRRSAQGAARSSCATFGMAPSFMFERGRLGVTFRDADTLASR
nr:hypothetical protein HUO10_004710 [Paraburkholderia busanensis]